MRRVARVVAGLVLGAVLPCGSAEAQGERLFAAGSRELVEVETGGAGLGRVRQTYRLPACDGGVTAEIHPVQRGLHLAWVSSRADLGFPDDSPVLCDVDVTAGTVHATPLPAGARIVAVDDARFRVMILATDRLLVFDVPGGPGREITLSGLGSGWYAAKFAYASGPGLLFVVSYGSGVQPLFPTPAPLTVTVVDVAAAVIRVISPAEPWSFVPNAVAVDAAGTALFVTPGDTAHTADWTYTRSVVRLRTDTGAIAAATTVPGLSYGTQSLILDERLRRVLSVGDGGTVIFDGATLAELGRLDTPRTRLRPSPGYDSVRLNHRVDFSPSTSRLYVQEREWERWSYYPGHCLRSTMIAVQPTGAAEVTDLTTLYGGPTCGIPAMLLISAPDVVTGLNASVTGSTVSLTWNETPGATHYGLEAGSAAGLANLAAIGSGVPRLTVDDVPPGTYHLRVRAIGVGGQGPRSADLVVMVP
jgi:hypothetical protein